ncbi:MAG TPA: autotransporter-associated beta strand repeat-containing protein, partial [Chthoniobacteraceae bacterium]|nr:autotransporter-associated beta strand repeat-containing protein [Chthoniobacteraceae bacterium]
VHGLWTHAGALSVGYNGTGVLTIGGAGTVQVEGLLTMGDGSAAVGVLNIGGQVGTDNVAAAPEAAGRLEVATIRGGSSTGSGGMATINFNHTDARYEFTGAAQAPIAITGNTTTRVNVLAGTTVLNGANTYKGATRITGGTLLANYTGTEAQTSSTGTGLVTVETDGTLGGIGRIAGATEVLGTLAPGDGENGTGVLNFDGDLTLGAESVTLLRLGGEARGTEHDAINIGGSFTLGGTLRLVLEEGLALQPNDELTFHLFQSDGFNGTFTLLDLPEISDGLALNWNTSLLYTDGSVSVNVAAIPEPGVAWLLLCVGAAAGVRFVGKRSLT